MARETSCAACRRNHPGLAANTPWLVFRACLPCLPNVRSRLRQPCSHCILVDLRVSRPLGVYIYAFGSRSSATRHNLLRSARLAASIVTAFGTLAVSCRGRGFIARPRAQPSGAPAPCIGNPRKSASSRNSAAVAATLPLLAYYPRLAAPEAHRARRLALRHALHSALGLRPRLSPRYARPSLRSAATLPLATTSLGEPNP